MKARPSVSLAIGTSPLLKLAASGALIAAILTAEAGTLPKANNTDLLNQPSSWIGGVVPGPADIALWNTNVTAANSVGLGADLSWAGIGLGSYTATNWSSPGGNVTLTNTGNSLTLGAAGLDLSLSSRTLTLNLPVQLNGSQTWNVYNGQTVTLGADVGGTGSILKLGNGTVTLSGANSFSGNLTMGGGSLNLNYAAATAPGTNLVPSSLSVTSRYNGGVITSTGRNSFTNSQTFNGVYLPGGALGLNVTVGTGSSSNYLNLGALSRPLGGGSLNFGTGAGLTTTITPNGASGILGPWATRGGTAVNSGTDWASVSGGIVGAYSGYTTLSGAAPAIANNPNSNVRLNSASTGNPVVSGGTVTVNTLLVNDPTARTVDIQAGSTLRLGAAGGILRSNGGPALTVGTGAGTGTLTAGGSDNTSGELVLNVLGGNGFTVNSAIADNGSGAVTLTLLGGNTATLPGTNIYTYSGGTYINNGSLALTGTGNGFLGTGPIYVRGPGYKVQAQGSGGAIGGCLWLNNTTSPGVGITNDVFAQGFGPGNNGALRFGQFGALNGTVTLIDDVLATSGNSNPNTINGRITGPGALWWNGSGNTRYLTVTANNNDYQGDTCVLANVLRITQAGGLPATTAVVLGGSLGTTPAALGAWLDVRADQTIAGLADGPMLTTGTRAVLNGNGGFAFNQGGPVAVTLTLSNNTRNLSYSGAITDNTNAPISLIKDGSYTQTLAGSNIVSGTVRIAAGTLALAHSNALQNAVLNLDGADTGTLSAGSLTSLNLGALTGSRNLSLPGVSLSLGRNDSAYNDYYGSLSGSGSLTKAGNSVQTLYGSSPYAGTLTIIGNSGGGLTLGAGGALPNIAQVTLVSNATFDVATTSGWSVGAGKVLGGIGTVNGTVTLGPGGTLSPGTSPGTLAVVGTLTFSGGGTNLFDLSPDPAGTSPNDVIDASASTLNLSGTTYLKINPYISTLGASEYPLIKYGTLGSGDAANFVVLPVAGYSLSVTNDTTVFPNMIALVVSPTHTPVSLTWRGNGTSQIWDNGNAANQVWRTAALVPAAFYNGDSVLFDNSGSNSPALSLSGVLAPAAIEVNATRNYTFGGTGKLSGAASIINDGLATLILATDNDYIGATVINAGTVQVGNGGASGALGSGPVVNQGALVINRTGALTIAGDLSGSGTLTVSGVQLSFGGNNSSFSGDATIAGGGAVLSPSDDSVLGYGQNLTLNNGTLATATATSMSRNVILGSGGGTLSNNASFTLSSGVSGNGSLAKSGAGRLIMTSGANTYSGNTLVSQGTLQVDAAACVPTNLVLNGGGVQFNMSGSYEQPGVISGLSPLSPTAGSIGVSAAPSDVTLHFADGSNIFNVPITNNCALLVLHASPSAQVFINGYNTPGFTLGPVAPDGGLRNNNNNCTLFIAGGVWNNNGANLGQNNTTARMYGTTIISNATFIAGGARYMMGIQYLEAGGSLLRTNVNTPAAATGTPNAARWNYETTPAGATCGVYVRPGSLLDNWSGAGLSGNNNSVYDLLGVAANQTFFLDIGGGTFLSGVNGDGVSRSMNLGWAEPTGTAYVNLSAGKMLVGGSIFTQGTSLNSFNWTGGWLGALGFDASGLPGMTLTNGGGTLAPGDTNALGRMTITGNYVIEPGAAALDIDLGGTSAATVFSTNAGNFYDRVVVTNGSVVLNGSLIVREINGFEPTVALNTSFSIVIATNIAGTFTNLSGGRIAVAGHPDRTFRVTVTSTNVVLDNYQTSTLQPYFFGTPTSGTSPLTVSFTDVSNGAGLTNRLWSFGDGSTTNTTATNVVHTYTLAGTNNVTLTISTTSGAASLTRTNYIIVTAPTTSPAAAGIGLLPDGNITLTVTGAVGTAWSLHATNNVGAPRPWPVIQTGTISVSPSTVDDLTATNYLHRFYQFSTP